MEHRQHLRFPVQFSSSFSSINLVRGEGTVVDISISGCRIFSMTEVKVGTALQLLIHVSKEDPPIQVAQAIVRWYRENTFGLAFLSLLPEAWPRLQQVVKELEREPYQCGNPSEKADQPC